MRASAEALRADGITFLNYVDPPSTQQGHQAPEHEPAQLTDDIQSLIEAEAPDLVLTHGSGGEYGHPAHRLLHEGTRAAIDTMELQPALYSFSAYHTARSERGPVNRWDWADLRLDVSVDEVKARALLCHRTQWTAFVGPQDTVEDYRAALVDHVVSLPAETYCCHRTGRPSISPAVFSTWVEELEPLRTHSLEAFRDGVKKHRHKVRIAAGEGLLALRQRLRRWFDG